MKKKIYFFLEIIIKDIIFLIDILIIVPIKN